MNAWGYLEIIIERPSVRHLFDDVSALSSLAGLISLLTLTPAISIFRLSPVGRMREGRSKKVRSFPLFIFNPQLTQALFQPRQRLFDHRTSLPFTFDAERPQVSSLTQQPKALTNVLRVHPIAQGAMAHRNAGLPETSFTCTWLTLFTKRFRKATGSCPAINVLPVSMFIRK
jgi:hypothetical protein